jgi:hypothetical protein
MQVRPSILSANISLYVKRDPKIRSINLFFNDKVMPKEFIPLGFGHDLISPDFNTSKERQMGSGGEFVKLVFHIPIFSACFALT